MDSGKGTEVSGQRSETSDQKTEQESGTANGKSFFWLRPKVILFGTWVLGVVLFFGLRYLVESFTHQSTDAAFLDGNVVSIAPRVAGQVQKAYVKNNQRVEAGAWLLDIDPRDLQVQLEQKQAALKAAQANVDLLLASVELLKTQIATAEATAKQTTAEAVASQATARNLGGSFGIAMVSTLLVRRAQVHQALMVAHLTPFDRVYVDRLAAATKALTPQSGPVLAQMQAQGLLYNTVLNQAILWAFVENCRLFGLFCSCCLRLVFLFKKARPQAPAPTPH